MYSTCGRAGLFLASEFHGYRMLIDACNPTFMPDARLKVLDAGHGGIVTTLGRRTWRVVSVDKIVHVCRHVHHTRLSYIHSTV